MGRSATACRPKFPMTNDLSRSRTVLEQDSTLIAVVELSLSNWVVAGPDLGIQRIHL